MPESTVSRWRGEQQSAQPTSKTTPADSEFVDMLAHLGEFGLIDEHPLRMIEHVREHV